MTDMIVENQNFIQCQIRDSNDRKRVLKRWTCTDAWSTVFTI